MKTKTNNLMILAMIAGTQTQKTIDTTTSTAVWTGRKIGGSHTGTIQLQSGTLDFDGQRLTGGSFTIDMSSIQVTDLIGDVKAQLEGHLHSDDFFSTANYGKATLDFTKIVSTAENNYEITADLTVKGITNEITFPLTVKGNEASTSFQINRAKYNVKFGSKSFFKSLGDNLIHDNFDLEVGLKF